MYQTIPRWRERFFISTYPASEAKEKKEKNIPPISISIPISISSAGDGGGAAARGSLTRLVRFAVVNLGFGPARFGCTYISACSFVPDHLPCAQKVSSSCSQDRGKHSSLHSLAVASRDSCSTTGNRASVYVVAYPLRLFCSCCDPVPPGWQDHLRRPICVISSRVMRLLVMGTNYLHSCGCRCVKKSSPISVI